MSTAPRRVPTRNKPRRPAWQRITFAVVAVVVVVLLVGFGVRTAYADKALPRTTVAGEDVGGMDEAQITAVVRKAGSGSRIITLQGPDKNLNVSAGGSGLKTDVPATVQQVLDARRGAFFGPLTSFLNGANVPLVASVDSAKLKATVERVSDAVDEEPYAGAVTIDPDTLNVSTRDSKAGRMVKQQEFTDDLRKRLLKPDGEKTVKIPVKKVKAVSGGDVQDVADAAADYVQTPLKLTGVGPTFTVSTAQLAELLALEPVNGGRDAKLGVDTAVLSRLTKRVAAARDREARSAKVSAPARGPVLDGKDEVSWKPKAAKVTVKSDGRTGVAVAVPSLNARIRAAIADGKHAVVIPGKTTQAPVSKASAAKINRVIGTFTTAYIAGQPRVTNIQRMAKTVDETIIAPGQQFSLNGITGERTKAKGYVEAPFIAGNKIEPSIGGGVSQFSTTMYNAAYFAGLQIDQHQPHSLFIDRYPPGRESTLNFPDIDMKWTNDTKAPILIRTYADDAGVTVTLYGNNGGRAVTATPGARVPSTDPLGNFNITVTRTIRYTDGREVKQPSTTQYFKEVVDEDGPQE
jgi:vancomycin resistance protein YoaR